MIDTRNVALIFLEYFTILAVYSNGDNVEKLVTPVPTEDVIIYTTTSSLTRDLIRDAANFSSRDNLASASITLDPTEQYQTMDGFGVAITDAACFNFLQMRPEDCHAFLTETFSDGKGFGFSYTRISIGCSDFLLSEYTCCDTKGIRHFIPQSEGKDYILPILKEILSTNPSIKAIAVPWIYPKWIKAKSLTDLTPLSSWTNGQLNPVHYQDYATYFMKWVQAFSVEGTDIYVVAPQDEPLNYDNSASLYVGQEKQRDSVRTALGPKFKITGLATRVYTYDYNYDYSGTATEGNYPGKMYRDAAASQYLAGTAYHNYGGNREELLNIYKAYSERELLFTKTSIGTWNSGRDLSKRLLEDMKEVALGTADDWCRGVMVWNLTLDNDRAPNRKGDRQICYGTADISNSDYKIIICNSHYYIIAHLSSVVKPGAIRIGASGYADSNIMYSAFENPDGAYASVLVNNNEKAKKTVLGDGKRRSACNVPGKSVTSYRWAKSE